MDSSTEICNLALSHIGISKQIADLDSEKSNEGRACRLFFETSRDAVLRDFAWPFATKIETLGLVESAPNDEWDYSYRKPSDCLAERRILSGNRQDTQESKVAYRTAQDDTGLLIYTDKEDAELEYTVRETRVNLWPQDFCLAVSFRLAAYIAPVLTGGDPFKLGDRSIQFYNFELGKAQANAFNEEQPDSQEEAESIRIRG
jgi:hypothetical protein